MKSFAQIKHDRNFKYQIGGLDGGMGRIGKMVVVFSNGGGWDHVSASFSDRCPTWEEMCKVKKIFFDDEECVVQFHPPKSEYVNDHPYTLHLWKKKGQEYETPPKIFVGRY